MIRHDWNEFNTCVRCGTARIPRFNVKTKKHYCVYYDRDGKVLADRPECIQQTVEQTKLFEVEAVALPVKEKTNKGKKTFHFNYTDMNGSRKENYSLYAKNLKDFLKLFKYHYFRCQLIDVFLNGNRVYPI